jgi:hypothetical protein
LFQPLLSLTPPPKYGAEIYTSAQSLQCALSVRGETGVIHGRRQIYQCEGEKESNTSLQLCGSLCVFMIFTAAIVRESLHLSGRMAHKVQDALMAHGAHLSPWGESKSVDLMPAAERWNIIFFQQNAINVKWRIGTKGISLLSAVATMLIGLSITHISSNYNSLVLLQCNLYCYVDKFWLVVRRNKLNWLELVKYNICFRSIGWFK